MFDFFKNIFPSSISSIHPWNETKEQEKVRAEKNDAWMKVTDVKDCPSMDELIKYGNITTLMHLYKVYYESFLPK